jgi:hypothetical protein
MTDENNPLSNPTGTGVYRGSNDPKPKGASTAGVKHGPSPGPQSAPPPKAGNPAFVIPPPGYYSPPGYYPPPAYGAPHSPGAPPGYVAPTTAQKYPMAKTAKLLGILSLVSTGLSLVLIIIINLGSSFWSSFVGVESYLSICFVSISVETLLAVTGLVLGIIGLVFGKKARKKIAASSGSLQGGNSALAGIICGIIGIVLGALIIILVIIGIVLLFLLVYLLKGIFI